MKERLTILQTEAISALQKAVTPDMVDQVRIKYLGRRGEINKMFKAMVELPVAQRKSIGKDINNVKKAIEERINIRLQEMKEATSSIDLLLPGRKPHVGFVHPLTKTFNEIITFFSHCGFSIATGPEIEYDWYNFEALNMSKDHPARDMFSSLYIKEDLMLRSHTSPVQIRVMEKHKPPVKIICPGRVYRYDAFDASHSPCFNQVEALYVDKGVSFGELKWILSQFVKFMFGEKTRYDLRPSFFPFTEPSGELAICCSVCGGNGCSVCGQSGWLELLGCGMVHPNVLKSVKISPKEYSGYALGMGVERVAMIKYVIDDIRAFFYNDIRFLEQF